MTREQLNERRATAAQQMEMSRVERDKQQRFMDTWNGVLQDCDFWLSQIPAEEPAKGPQLVPAPIEPNTIHEDEMKAAEA